MMTIALELQHGVDNVFEHARSGEPTFLGDVTHQDDGQVSTLGLHDQFVGAPTYLHHAAG